MYSQIYYNMIERKAFIYKTSYKNIFWGGQIALTPFRSDAVLLQLTEAFFHSLQYENTIKIFLKTQPVD